MYEGCITIAASSGGPTEIIKNKKEGYLVDEENYQVVSEKIGEIKNNLKSKSIEKIKGAARKKVILNHTLDDSFSKLKTDLSL
jgi:glycosyltransferase involved in cell wall biosynthesis